MKRIAFILLSFALTSGAMAQTATKKAEMDKKKTEKQLQTTIKEKKDEKHEVGSDLKHLKVSAAVKDRKEVRSDRRRIHRKAHHLKKAHGVDHPTIKAQKEVKEAKDQRKGKH
jgi:hypothetical protein